MLTNNGDINFLAMRLVEQCSTSLHTLSWIWGGFTVDILENRMLREHDDLDYLTLNLHSLIPDFIRFFESWDWQTQLLTNGDLKIKRPNIKIHLGHVEISERVRWTHNGDQGSIWFPPEWLNTTPKKFCDIGVHVVQPEFQYVMLERPQMLDPDWKCREKDITAREYLKNCIESKGICPQSLLEQVSDKCK